MDGVGKQVVVFVVFVVFVVLVLYILFSVSVSVSHLSLVIQNGFNVRFKTTSKKYATHTFVSAISGTLALIG